MSEGIVKALGLHFTRLAHLLGFTRRPTLLREEGLRICLRAQGAVLPRERTISVGVEDVDHRSELHGGVRIGWQGFSIKIPHKPVLRFKPGIAPFRQNYTLVICVRQVKGNALHTGLHGNQKSAPTVRASQTFL